MATDLDAAQATLAEAGQSVLRAAGVAGGYELLRHGRPARGQTVDTRSAARARSHGCRCPSASGGGSRLCARQGYVGLAAELTRRVLANEP